MNSTHWIKFKKVYVENKYLYLMLILPVSYFLIFKYGPLFGLVIAFKNFNIMKGFLGSEWVGLKYFREFLTEPYFWLLIKNTLLMNLYMILFAFPAPIILALLFNEIKGVMIKKLAQTVSYLPHFLSTVVISGMLITFLSHEGLINQIMVWMGQEPLQFLYLPQWFRTIYISSEIWQGVGWGSIIYLAALTAIDPQLYEAAMMDGAGRWRKMIHVTIPGIIPIITIMFLLNIGNILSIGFEKILLLYTGATYETADVISTYVYRRGLLGSDFSFTTAIELSQSVINLIFIVSANWLVRKLNGTSLW
jgi:putative aldouronate transport system permease protein